MPAPSEHRPSPRLTEPLAERDSRAAALRILQPGRTRVAAKALTLVVVAALVFFVWNALTGKFPSEQRAVLLLLMLAIGLWVTEAVPAFAVGLLIMGYLVFALGTPLWLDEPADVTPYLNTWSSQVIWLMLGGFFLAEGMARTGLDRRLLALALRPAGTRPERILLAIMLTAAGASMFISNTSTTVLLTSAVLPLVHRLGPGDPFGRGLLVAIPLAAAVGGMGTIIGSPPNAIAAATAAEFGRNIDFVEWMLLGVPVSLVLIGVAWRLLLRRYPARAEAVALELDSGVAVELPGQREQRIVSGIAVVTVALWLTTPLHGVHTAAISLIPIVGLTLSQVVGTTEVRRLPWDTLMLVAGGMSLGVAVLDTGLAARLASSLAALSGVGSTALVFAVLALLTVALSNIMSNTATVSLVVPVAVALLPGRELETCMIIGLSASCALLLPVSTPPNAIVFSTGAIETRDFRPGGLLVGLLGPVLIIAWVLSVARFVG